MDEAETDVLAYVAFPPTHRAKPHSVSPLERLNSLPSGRSAEPWGRDQAVHRPGRHLPQRGRHHPPGRGVRHARYATVGLPALAA
jgi:hypothetical protein